MADDIEARLARLEAMLGALCAHLGVRAGGGPPRAAQTGSTPSTGGTGGEIAPDSDLDSKWGDPEIRKDPKRWNVEKGGSYVGCRLSQCPSDYLDTLADFTDWCAEQSELKKEKTNKGQDRAPLLRRDAARARGWAARNRGRRIDPPPPKEVQPEEEIPF